MTSKPKIILLGAGGHASACIDVIEQEDKFIIAGLIGLEHELGSFVNGYEVIATDDSLTTIQRKISNAIVTLGQIKSPEPRKSLYRKALSVGFNLATVISPLSYISRTAQIGAGTIVMHGAMVNSRVKIGMNCIVNSKSLIEHDSRVSDHCHVSTGAILNGGVYVGEGSFVGSGALIKQGVSVKSDAVICMGCILRSESCTDCAR